ncbi:MAG: ATP-binding protein [Desulfobacterales bacterium]|nr:ATP-binding protein [Desulfobacterales bacterium]
MTEIIKAEAKLEIESGMDGEKLARVRAFIGEFCAGIPDYLFDSDQTEKIVLAGHEVVTNIIRHAYGDKCTGELIQIKIRISENKLVLLFYDWSEKRFDPLPPRSPHGLFIIDQCVDKIRYSRDDNGKNCCCLEVVLKPGGDR